MLEIRLGCEMSSGFVTRATGTSFLVSGYMPTNSISVLLINFNVELLLSVTLFVQSLNDATINQ